MRQEYLIESRDSPGSHWFIVGSDRSNLAAQRYMRDYMRQYPRRAFRVVESPSRIHQIIVCADEAGE